MKHIKLVSIIFLIYFQLSTSLYSQGWQNLNKIAEGNNLLGVAWATSTTAVAVGTNATLLRTTNSGATWVKIDVGYTRRSIRAVRFLNYDYADATGTHTVKIGVAVGGYGGIWVGNSLNADPQQPIVLLSKNDGQNWDLQTTVNDDDVNLMDVELFRLPGSNIPQAVAVGSKGGEGRVLVCTNLLANTPSWQYLTTTGATPELPGDIIENIVGNEKYPGNNLCSVRFFPNTNIGIAVGDNGYLIRTTDGGAHWTQHQGLDPRSKPSAPLTHWLAWSRWNPTPIPEKCYPSETNNNYNPDAIPHNLEVSNPVCIAVNSSGACLIGGAYNSNPSGVWYGDLVWSSDFGATWQANEEALGANQHKISVNRLRIGGVTSCYLYPSGKIIFSGHYGRILSTDFSVSDLAVSEKKSHCGTTTYQRWNQEYNNNYYSLDYASDHYTKSVLEPQEKISCISVSPFSAENILAVGLYGNVWRSTDGGDTWLNCMDNSNYTITLKGLNATTFLSNDEGWAIGDRWTVLHATRNTSGDWNWQQQSPKTIVSDKVSDLSADLHSVFFLPNNHNIGWMVGEGGVIFKTINKGQKWIQQNIGDRNYQLKSVYFRNETHGWAVGSDNTVLFTSDGGNNWTANPVSPTGVTIDPKKIYYSVTEANGCTIIVGENIILRSNMLQTDPLTATWTRCTVNFQPSERHNRNIYDINGNNPVTNSDPTPITPRYWLRSVKYMSSNIWYAVGYMYGGLSKPELSYSPWVPGLGLILYSSNNGQTWTEETLNNSTSYAIGERLIPQCLYDIAFEGNQAWIVGTNGYIIHTINAQLGPVTVTSDSPTSTKTVWGSISANTKEQNSHTQWSLTSVSLIPNSGTGSNARLIAVGNWGTILETSDAGGLGKAIHNNDEPEQLTGQFVSNTPELYQNVPNPFNQSTTISFYVPNKSHVTLSIVNGLGQTIDALVNESIIDSGQHTIEYQPAIISTGVYYCRLVVDGVTFVKPLVIIR